MLLTHKIEAILTERIREGIYPRGERLPSIRELSKELEASYVSVFRAIDAMKKNGIVDTCKGSGIFVKRQSALPFSSGARQIAFVFADPADNPREEYLLEVYTYVQSALRKNGYIDLALRFDESRIAEPEKLAGAIVTHRSPLLPWFRKNHIPTVYCSSASGEFSFSSVSPDFYQGSYEATGYLIRAGHRNIKMVTAADIRNKGSFIPRCRGYADAMTDNGLMPQPELEWNAKDMESRKAFDTLLTATDRPTALFVANDIMAIEIMHAARELNLKIPEDISVTGLENMHCSYNATPPLTTMNYDKEKLAAETVGLLLELIDGRQQGPVNKMIPMELMARDSVLARHN